MTKTRLAPGYWGDLKNKNRLVFFLSFFLSIVILPFYIARISPSVFSADSGDLLAAILTGGVAHPPGYPLYNLLGKIFILLPLKVTVAWKVGLISSLSIAFSVGLTFYLSYLLTKKIIPSLIASISFAFLYSVWIYAEVTEVFALALFFSSLLSLLALFAYWDLRKGNLLPRSFLLLSFVFGIAFTHHHIVALFLPAFLYLFLPYYKRIFTMQGVITTLVSFLLGFSVYFYSYISALRQPFINWDNPVTLVNFFRLITRADYGTFTLVHFFSEQNVLNRLFQIWPWIYFLYLDWSFLGVCLAFLGILFSRRFFSRYYGFLVIAIIMFGPLFSFYGAYPLVSPFLLGIFERFLIFSSIFLVPFVSFGVFFLSEFLFRIVPFKFEKNKQVVIMYCMELLFILLPITLFLRNKERTDFAKFTLGDDLGRAIFQPASSYRAAILFLRGDVGIFNTWYIALQPKGTVPKNVALVAMDLLDRPGAVETLRKYYPWLELPKGKDVRTISELIAFIITHHQKKMPIFSVEAFDLPNKDKYKFIPHGGVLKIVSKDFQPSVQEELAYYERFLPFISAESTLSSPLIENFFVKDLVNKFGLIHYQYGKFFLESGNLAQAEKAVLRAQRYALEISPPYFTLGKIYQKQERCNKAESEFLKYLRKNKDSTDAYHELEQNALYCFRDKKKAEQYRKKLEDLSRKSQHPLREL